MKDSVSNNLKKDQRNLILLLAQTKTIFDWSIFKVSYFYY